MVYELVVGESLFGSRGGSTSAEQVMSSILNDDNTEEQIKKLPNPYQALVRTCLVKNASVRVQSAGELIAILKGQPVPQETNDGSGGLETMVFSLPVQSSNADLATIAIDIAETPRPVEIPLNQNNKRPIADTDNEEKKKRSPMLMIGIILLILGAIGGGFFYYHNSSNIDQDYLYAKQHYGDTTTEFLPRLIKSDQKGNDSAKVMLARFYFKTNKIDQAITTIQPLVDKKHTDAITLLDSCDYEAGMSYYNQKNYSKSFELFNKAATHGNAQAECMLGTLYLYGQGTPEKSNSEAFKWYLKSSEQKNEVAMYCVGMFYADGTGVEKNKNEANTYLGWVLKNATNSTVKKAAMDKLKTLYAK